MKRNAIIGLIAVIVVIVCAFLPWITVQADEGLRTYTGLSSEGSSFGEPGKLSIFVAVLTGVFFLIPKDWAARANLFPSAFLAAWAFRNMLLYSRCEMGICPDQRYGLWLSLLAALTSFVCVLMHRKKFVQ
ncbi:hypothetical protein [Chitinophaga caseinilytica]|uniref:Uncharacterized protein n=1 Tax=Chitinophaga caseinilytica TaxID=2267521 RepID=A0ABZ2YXX6_9BACT